MDGGSRRGSGGPVFGVAAHRAQVHECVAHAEAKKYAAAAAAVSCRGCYEVHATRPCGDAWVSLVKPKEPASDLTPRNTVTPTRVKVAVPPTLVVRKDCPPICYHNDAGGHLVRVDNASQKYFRKQLAFGAPPVPPEANTEWALADCSESCRSASSTAAVPVAAASPSKSIDLSRITGDEPPPLSPENPDAPPPRPVVGGRLRSGAAWAAAEEDTEPWLQLDLGKPRRVGGLVVRGSDEGSGVTVFTVSASADGRSWVPLERGRPLPCAVPRPPPADGEQPASAQWRRESVSQSRATACLSGTASQLLFGTTVPARFVRVYPKEWEGSVRMRVGLLVERPGRRSRAPASGPARDDPRRWPAVVMKRSAHSGLNESDSVALPKSELGAAMAVANRAVHSSDVVVLQQFKKPDGPHASVLRIVWREARGPVGWRITGTQKLAMSDAEEAATTAAAASSDADGVKEAGTLVPLSSRWLASVSSAPAAGGMGQTIEIAPLRGGLLADGAELASRIAKLLRGHFRPRVQFNEFCCDFIRGSGSQLWLLQVKGWKALEVRPDGPERLMKVTKPSADSRVRLRTCGMCRRKLPAGELSRQLTQGMIVTTVARLRMRGDGTEIPSVVDSTASRHNGPTRYSLKRVCDSCYQAQLDEERAVRSEYAFAEAIGIPTSREDVETQELIDRLRHRRSRPQRRVHAKTEGTNEIADALRVAAISEPALAAPEPVSPTAEPLSPSWGPYPEADPPSHLKQWSVLVYFQDVHHIPPEIARLSNLSLRSALLGQVDTIPLPGSDPSRRRAELHSLRVHHLLLPPRAACDEWLRLQKNIVVELCSGQRVIGVCKFPLSDFVGGKVPRREMVGMFNTARLRLMSLRVLVGVAPGRIVSSATHPLKPHPGGCWVPSRPYYSADDLPAEWRWVVSVAQYGDKVEEEDGVQSRPGSMLGARAKSIVVPSGGGDDKQLTILEAERRRAQRVLLEIELQGEAAKQKGAEPRKSARFAKQPAPPTETAPAAASLALVPAGHADMVALLSADDDDDDCPITASLRARLSRIRGPGEQPIRAVASRPQAWEELDAGTVTRKEHRPAASAEQRARKVRAERIRRLKAAPRSARNAPLSLPDGPFEAWRVTVHVDSVLGLRSSADESWAVEYSFFGDDVRHESFQLMDHTCHKAFNAISGAPLVFDATRQWMVYAPRSDPRELLAYCESVGKLRVSLRTAFGRSTSLTEATVPLHGIDKGISSAANEGATVSGSFPMRKVDLLAAIRGDDDSSSSASVQSPDSPTQARAAIDWRQDASDDDGGRVVRVKHQTLPNHDEGPGLGSSGTPMLTLTIRVVPVVADPHTNPLCIVRTIRDQCSLAVLEAPPGEG